MTGKEFMNKIANGKIDILSEFLDVVRKMKTDYCLIGGLAVNAYVEPVVSLDLDIVVATKGIDKLCKAVEKIFTIKNFPHSLNLTSSQSDIRIQLQTDECYQPFICRAKEKQIMGYEMKVAVLEDVLQGKIWAYSDDLRRKSKRQKDLADIFRLVEAYPYLRDLLPDSIRSTGI